MAIIRLLKLVARYGAYALVIFEIVEFAIGKLEPLISKEEKKQVKEHGNISE